MEKKKKIRFSKTIRELILCFTQQGLNKCAWGITLQEYLFLKEVEGGKNENTNT